MYDYLIVGAGLFGSICAHELKNKGKKVLVIDKRSHIGGNCYTQAQEGINVHKYGAHIFHTSNQRVIDYITKFAKFNNYVNSPIAIYKDELYNLPFNMNTFSKMWGIKTPQEAQAVIQQQQEREGIVDPSNFEEQALSLAGRDIYEKLVKGYTEKQWGQSAKELPAEIIKRLPFRFTYDNNYFNDTFQGIPIGGYTGIFTQLLSGVEVRLNEDYLAKRKEYEGMADKIIYTGMIDAYYNYIYGHLGYRSLKFVEKTLDTDNFQGNAVVNYTAAEVPYTRIIEHKHFEFGKQPKTVITYEYPMKWEPGSEPYYSVNNESNNELFSKYDKLAKADPKVIFGGRLGYYQYLDMDKVIDAALNTVSQL